MDDTQNPVDSNEENECVQAAKKSLQGSDYWGCLSMAWGCAGISFLIIASTLSLFLLPALAPGWPIWASLSVGLILALAIMTLSTVGGGDLLDVLVRLFAVAIITAIITPVIINAKHNGELKRQRDALHP